VQRKKSTLNKPLLRLLTTVHQALADVAFELQNTV
jgi:hypothetical protein